MDEKKIEQISVMHIDDMPENAKQEVKDRVGAMPQTFRDNFEGFAEIRMVSTSPMRIDTIEPIVGTDVDWFKKNSMDSEIDSSDIF